MFFESSRQSSSLYRLIAIALRNCDRFFLFRILILSNQLALSGFQVDFCSDFIRILGIDMKSSIIRFMLLGYCVIINVVAQVVRPNTRFVVRLAIIFVVHKYYLLVMDFVTVFFPQGSSIAPFAKILNPP
ncbi:hypothetical protein NIES4101_29440 [Calothrix sp. NIES-4101]|nr:hypothetical protein NIES4101_29440 [Calothrix sp. NIES-4101]